MKLDKKGNRRLLAILIPPMIVGLNLNRLETKDIWSGETIILALMNTHEIITTKKGWSLFFFPIQGIFAT